VGSHYTAQRIWVFEGENAFCDKSLMFSNAIIWSAAKILYEFEITRVCILNVTDVTRKITEITCLAFEPADLLIGHC